MSVKDSGAAILGLTSSPYGPTLDAARDFARVRLWDPVTGQVVVLEGHARRVNSVRFGPDGRTLACASHDGEIRLWHAGSP